MLQVESVMNDESIHRNQVEQPSVLPNADTTQPGDIALIPLEAIILDDQYQPRGWTSGVYDLDADHLERLAASDPATWPPLLVKPAEKSEYYYLLDGWHRYFTAKERLGLTALPCRVKPDGNVMDAVRANLSHGLPLSNADRKAYAIWLYESHPEDQKPSYRALAREAGLSHNTIRAAVEAAGQIDQQATSDRVDAPPDSGLRRITQLLSQATREWGGMNPFVGNADEQRTRHMRKLLASYAHDPKKQRQLIQDCREWGAALVAAAETVELQV
jgi:hypothetical protein